MTLAITPSPEQILRAPKALLHDHLDGDPGRPVRALHVAAAGALLEARIDLRRAVMFPRPMPGQRFKIDRADDGPRAGVTLEAVAALQPVFRPDGTVTAGNCCALNDGAAAVMLMTFPQARLVMEGEVETWLGSMPALAAEDALAGWLFIAPALACSPDGCEA